MKPPYRRIGSGEKRHTIDILAPPAELDDRGQLVGEWRPCHVGVRAKIEPLAGRQLESARAIYSEAAFRITFGYLNGVQARFRLKLRSTGQLFHLGYVDNVSYEHVETSCLASEVQ